jgi:hypothetical protein
VILTDGQPYVATGATPEVVTLSPIETYAPCVSARGALDIGRGVIYPSHDGLFYARAGDATNIGRNIWTRDEWRDMGPESFVAGFHNDWYYASHQAAGGVPPSVMVAETDNPDGYVGITEDSVTAWHTNRYDGNLYAAIGNTIYQWDAPGSTAIYTSSFWSKEYDLTRDLNFGAARVRADFGFDVPNDEGTITANEALLADLFLVSGAIGDYPLGADIPAGGTNINIASGGDGPSVTFYLIEGDTILFSKQISSDDPFRLPSGFRQRKVTVGINSNIPVFRVEMAETMRELRA